MDEWNYLFAYFTGETEDGEQIYFSGSMDGLHWHDFNEGRPVLRNTIGAMGVRDPFLFRSVIDGQYYILGTDLRIAGGVGWEEAQNAGSTRVVIWTSGDLVHWSAPWFFPVGIEGAGCAWAPETIYDKGRKAYMVFWASCVNDSVKGRKKQVIFCSYTRDFRNFSQCGRYMEFPYDVIDATIVQSGEKYFRFYKDETEKYIRMDVGTDLQGPFREIRSPFLKQLTGVEGAIVYPLKGRNEWCLLADQFAKGCGYLPLRCKNLEDGTFNFISGQEYDMGKTRKRHGSVLACFNAENG